MPELALTLNVSDIDTVDNTLGDAMRMLVATLANIVGAIILIGIVIPWFLVAVAAILVCYIWAAFFYRASARELKVSPPSEYSVRSGRTYAPSHE